MASTPLSIIFIRDARFHPMHLALAILFVALAIWRFAKSLAAAAGKKRLRRHPLAGTMLHVFLNFHRLHDYMADIARKHRTFRLHALFRSMVYTTEPANVEHVLKTNFANYGKGSVHYEILTDFLGDGIFVVDGEKWRQQRKVSSYEFTNKIYKEFSIYVFRTNAVKLARILSESESSNASIEIQEQLMNIVLDSVFKVILGAELGSGTTEEGTKFLKAFDVANRVIMERYINVFWKFSRFLKVGSEGLLKDSIRAVDEFVYKIIKDKIEQKSKEKEDDNENGHDLVMKKGDLLSRFLQLGVADPKYLRDITLCFILAGRETTATTLAWFLALLCKHPLVQEKVALEVVEATNLVKDCPTFEEIAASVTLDALDKMHYLHAALSETLRLYPALPVDGKLCFSDDTLPDGFTVKKGDLVFYHPYAMGRMKFLWGDDAEEFRPERWLDQDGIYCQESPFKFTAFQAGPRICLGKEFAYKQMKIFGAILLSAYVFRLREDRDVAYKPMLTLPIEGGLHVKVSRRRHFA